MASFYSEVKTCGDCVISVNKSTPIAIEFPNYAQGMSSVLLVEFSWLGCRQARGELASQYDDMESSSWLTLTSLDVTVLGKECNTTIHLSGGVRKLAVGGVGLVALVGALALLF